MSNYANDYYDYSQFDEKGRRKRPGRAVEEAAAPVPAPVFSDDDWVRVCPDCGGVFDEKHAVCEYCDAKLGVLMKMSEARQISADISAAYKAKHNDDLQPEAKVKKSEGKLSPNKKSRIACGVVTGISAAALVGVMAYTKYVYDLLMPYYKGDYLASSSLEQNLGFFFCVFILMLVYLGRNICACINPKLAIALFSTRSYSRGYRRRRRARIDWSSLKKDNGSCDDVVAHSWFAPVAAFIACGFQMCVLLHEFMKVI